jgi:hypothetical protein
MSGPLAGQLSNRIGNGATMALEAAVFGLALCGTLIPSLAFIMAVLAGHLLQRVSINWILK